MAEYSQSRKLSPCSVGGSVSHTDAQVPPQFWKRVRREDVCLVVRAALAVHRLGENPVLPAESTGLNGRRRPIIQRTWRQVPPVRLRGCNGVGDLGGGRLGAQEGSSPQERVNRW